MHTILTFRPVKDDACVRTACGGYGSGTSDGPDGDRQRAVLELEEVWRGLAAAGFDDDADVVDGRARCSVCEAEVAAGDLPRTESRAAVDTVTGRDDLLVIGSTCPS